MSDWQSKVAENAQRYRNLGERLAQLSITETSRDGAVRVTVSSNGLLTGLELTESGQPKPLPELAAQVMDCVRRAQARIPNLLKQAMTESVGDTDPNTHLLVADARRRFPEPPPVPEQPGWQPDEVRFNAAETPAIPAIRTPPRPTRPHRTRNRGEEQWDEEVAILKDV
ncbi:YbaB/EbfC family nucleoid-associated protein [Actinophytocola sp.]|uniref:YbaB/EbfC family nucleoid-associated protein n=1 Tax=Actinophytocola sp. TaxID=1872138 RepID=UPI002ED0B8F0